MYVWSAVCPSEREQNPRRSPRALTGKTQRGAEDYRLEGGIPHVRPTISAGRGTRPAIRRPRAPALRCGDGKQLIEFTAENRTE